MSPAEPFCSGPVPGAPLALLGGFDLGLAGCVAEEWLLDGTATSWRPACPFGDDGLWDTEVSATAPYRTRLVVCRPSDPSRFSGTVVVEWLNVSGGGDSAPGWAYVHRHLLRGGAAWVGVSAQRAGIEGGGLVATGQHLKQLDPDRYATLEHPGDAFSFDIFSQAGEVLRRGAGPLAGHDIQAMLAMGVSQSATYLITYVNAVDAQAGVYDGVLLQGRSAIGAPLVPRGPMPRPRPGRPIFDPLGIRDAVSDGHRIRLDARVPVITVQSETDVIMRAGIRARQPDSERFRLWEIAGTAHGDVYGFFASGQDDGSLPIDDLAALMAPTDDVLGQRLPAPINAAPQQHYVLQAAIAHLDSWVRGGAPPPYVPRLEADHASDGGLVLDELGIARGGIRTPWVDVPVSVLSGAGQDGAAFSPLFGVTRPFGQSRLAQLYPGGHAQYLAAFERCLDEAIAAGVLLELDRKEILALAAASSPLRDTSSERSPDVVPQLPKPHE